MDVDCNQATSQRQGHSIVANDQVKILLELRRHFEKKVTGH